MSQTKSYVTHNKKLNIICSENECTSADVDALAQKLDTSRGVLLTSRYEYPGRYTRYDIGFVNPPLAISVIENKMHFEALNARGEFLIPIFKEVLDNCEFYKIIESNNKVIIGQIENIDEHFFEEDRSHAPHVLNVIRHLKNELFIDDSHIGFYGAFGYDLGLDFMGVKRTLPRNDLRDLVLYFADEIFITDHENKISKRFTYEFEFENGTTSGMERSGDHSPYVPDHEFKSSRENSPEQYSEIVSKAKEYFARGDLFEVVPSYSFNEACEALPSVVFETLLSVNPAPFGALINLGNNEFTISASPEMFVRVEGNKVESCPIAGTIARGAEGVSDAEQIEKLLMSEKEDSELIMCTDVDRNDKARVCVPESIQVIGRRQIEIYSRLIHTVDHVQGILLDQHDCIDAFLTHMWAVTVTGAPKMWACKFIEEFESSSRRYYGGAMGVIGLDGSMNTGLMLRTIHLHSGAAHIRVGATLLFDSDPIEETKETELKASAMLDVVRHCHKLSKSKEEAKESSLKLTNDKTKGFALKDKTGSDMNSEQSAYEFVKGDLKSKNVLLIDCEDSFVNTLGSYFRIANAQVRTIRASFDISEFEKLVDEFQPDLICLSPGPGSPKEFGLDKWIAKIIEHKIPIFGVCLGLQALVEYFGGTLGQLENPMHGKKSEIEITDASSYLFEGIDSPFSAGRYHSLYADKNTFPLELKALAHSASDEIIMAIEHQTLPICAVQFHPESIMTFDDNVGNKLILNVLKNYAL